VRQRRGPMMDGGAVRGKEKPLPLPGTGRQFIGPAALTGGITKRLRPGRLTPGAAMPSPRLALALLIVSLPVAAAEPEVSGPEAEKRFPPLRLPPGFKATLFACDPMIEYPSVIALGPKPRSLFVAV